MSDPTAAAHVHDAGAHDDDGGVHISPNSMYFVVFAALAVLTVLTWFVARFHFGPFNDVIALGIAFTKASLVVFFFMHVKYAGRLIRLVVVAALLWLSLMMGLTVIDYQSRERIVADPDAVPSSLTITPPPVAPVDENDGGEH